MIGCTDLLAEPGIPRTRTGRRRLVGATRANHGAAYQLTTKDYARLCTPSTDSTPLSPQALLPAAPAAGPVQSPYLTQTSGRGRGRTGRTRAGECPGRQRHHDTDRLHAAGRCQLESPGQGQLALTAGGVSSSFAGPRPGGPKDGRPGGDDLCSPVESSHRLPAFCRSVSADCHPGGGGAATRSPEASSRQSPTVVGPGAVPTV